MADYLNLWTRLTKRLFSGPMNMKYPTLSGVELSVGEKNRVIAQWFDMGMRNLDFELYGQAASYFSNVVALRPEWDEARYHLGRAYLGLRQREKAMEQLEILRDRKSEWASRLDEALDRR